jgi:hypothetical protein
MIAATKISVNTEETMQDAQRALNEYINNELDKSMLEANDPNVKRLSHDDIVARIDMRREARGRV